MKQKEKQSFTMVSKLLVILVAVALGYYLSEAKFSKADPWLPIQQAVDNYTLIPDLTIIIGDKSGPLYTYSKGNFNASFSEKIASTTKWTTGIIINKLVEQGLMSYDDHPQKYIEWWTSDPKDERSWITLSQLLSFSSGLITENMCILADNVTFEACAKEMYTAGLARTPGIAFEYGSVHLQIAGLMAIKAAQIDLWVDLFDKIITKPLNLGKVSWWPSNENPILGGGLIASPQQVATIVRAIFNYQIINKQTTQIMESDHVGKLEILTRVFQQLIGQDWHYGYGVWVECNQYNWTSTCDNYGQFSSGGAWGYYPWIDRVNDYWAVLGTFHILGVDKSMLLGNQLKPLIVKAMK
jgi:CubicO group peptidase (beta-lactamase class C family)